MLVNLYAVTLSFTLLICIYQCWTQFHGGLCKVHFKRVVFSVVVSLLVAVWGFRRRSLNGNGALAGILVGFLHTMGSYCFLACLFTFFYTSSKATNFNAQKKRKFESDFKEGGQRNWVQVLCNGGASSQLALIYLLYRGPGEIAVQFHRNFLESWLAVGVLSALAAAIGDTWASELGSVLATSEPRLIIGFKKVPVGTNGGFTLIGLFFSALGGALVGFSYLVALLLSGAQFSFHDQAFLLVSVGAFAGLFGSTLDSVIGATLQYSGLNISLGKVVETPGIGVKHISGRQVLDNHTVNLVMTVASAVTVPTLAAYLFR